MRRRSIGLVVLCLFVLTFVSPGEARERSRWDFTVYLDQKKIGSHSFEVTNASGVTRVRSEAKFKYSILLIPAYRYEHSAAERWSNNCLIGLDASTNANGERIRVSGERRDGRFTIVSDDGPADLPGCVMSFAYWNPDFLEQTRLLNPQTGDFVTVRVEEAGIDELEIRGELVRARRFHLQADKLDLTLWYSDDDEWLGLESVAKGGRILRYELS